MIGRFSVKDLYELVLILSFGMILFSVLFSMGTQCNQYVIAEKTLHGTVSNISYITPEHTTDTIYMDITEDDYTSSMHRFGIRHGVFAINMLPNELVGEDKVIKTVGDHLMAKYSDDYSRANAANTFCQTAITYASDDVVYGAGDYWARPLETVYNGKGDCEDVAVLFVSLCRYMGIPTVFLGSDEHTGAAVRSDNGVSYYIFNDERYLTCALTFDFAYGIGKMQTDDTATIMDDEPSYIYWVYSIYVDIGCRAEAMVRNGTNFFR